MNPSIDDTILKYNCCLSDPRIDRSKQHLLEDIIAIAILTVLSKAEAASAIETYAPAKQKCLKQFLALPNSILSHNIINRVFASLCPASL